MAIAFPHRPLPIPPAARPHDLPTHDPTPAPTDAPFTGAMTLPIESSAATLVTPRQGRAVAISAIVVLIMILLDLERIAIGVVGAAMVMYAINLGWRFVLLGIMGRSQPLHADDATLDEIRSREDLPIVSVMVPIKREGQDILKRLAYHLQQLDYPQDRLDVMILLDSDETQTIANAEAVMPPAFRILVVPAVLPRTKPRVLNVALRQARGTYVVVWDVEDAPHPQQVIQAVAAYDRLRETEPDVICLQARLAFDSDLVAKPNLLTRWQTAAYNLQFGLFLPALDRMRLPVPLGGTSNFFRVDALRDLGGWDAWNVTEDLDLGIRIARHGYRVRMLDSTTWEEPNPVLWNSIRQWSRWKKGAMQTWLVHMRHPIALFRDLGPEGFLSFQLTVGVQTLALLLNPISLLLTLVYVAFQPAWIHTLFPIWVLYLGNLSFFGGTIFFVFATATASLHMRRRLRPGRDAGRRPLAPAQRRGVSGPLADPSRAGPSLGSDRPWPRPGPARWHRHEDIGRNAHPNRRPPRPDCVIDGPFVPRPTHQDTAMPLPDPLQPTTTTTTTACRSRLARAFIIGLILVTGFSSQGLSTVTAQQETPMLGMNVLYYGYDASQTDLITGLLDNLEAMHVNTIILNVPIFIDSLDGNQIEAVYDGSDQHIYGDTPHPAEMQAFIKPARARGFTVWVRPLLDEASLIAEDPNTWRGQLEPSDPSLFFANYTQTLKDLLVGSTGASWFVIGTEFGSLQEAEYDQYWSSLIDAICRYPSGQGHAPDVRHRLGHGGASPVHTLDGCARRHRPRRLLPALRARQRFQHPGRLRCLVAVDKRAPGLPGSLPRHAVLPERNRDRIAGSRHERVPDALAMAGRGHARRHAYPVNLHRRLVRVLAQPGRGGWQPHGRRGRVVVHLGERDREPRG
ncbi:MAG: glycosyltransferase family 2 protein [Thermomicrobiales bacterium]